MTAIRMHPDGSRRATMLLSLLVSLATAAAVFPGEAVSATSDGSAGLSVQRVIRTTSFVQSTVSTRDNEGSAYVGRDHALWLVDDIAQRIYVVNPRTGALKRVIGARTLSDVRRYRGTRRAGAARSRDLESVAYDAARDRIYVFGGNDCEPSWDNCQDRSRATAFRFDRISGRLRPHSYQPLGPGSDPTAAAWNPADKQIYVGASETIRSYSFTRNSHSAWIQVEGLHEILGMDFNARGSSLFVVHNETMLSRVDWGAKSLAVGWPLDLARFGVRDARGVEQIGGKLFVSDGYDHRRQRSPRRYAVFVLE
jgi:DNA-binding beta-propeller fold protein YncE